MAGVDGPGRFALFLTGSFGESEVLFNSADRLPQRLDVPINTHAHGNWAFSEPGIYRLAFEMSAVLVPVSKTRASIMFVDNRARVVYGQLYVDDVAIDFPKLTIILAHAGRPLYGETASFLVRRHRNVFLDLSGIPPKALLRYVPRLRDLADKALWGTDWPSPGVASPRIIHSGPSMIISGLPS